MSDEIIEELWGIKDGMAREHNYDVRALAPSLQSKNDARNARIDNLGVESGDPLGLLEGPGHATASFED